MSVEFVDTNILVYAHDGGAGEKHHKSVQLLERLLDEGAGALSVQVLEEFYAAATKKLRMEAQEIEEAIIDLGIWTIHRPGHADVLRASRLLRRHKIAWRDALILNSASNWGATCSGLKISVMGSGMDL